MPGAHQYGHLAATLAALAPWLQLDAARVTQAVLHTQNPARLMQIPGRPRWLFDVAHNADSAEVLAAWLHDMPRDGGRFIALCGMLRDKDHHAIYRHLALEIDQWILAGLGGPRGTDVQTLAAHAREAGIAAEKLLSCDDIPAAYHHARTLARPEDTVVVFGSFVTVAAVLEKHI